MRPILLIRPQPAADASCAWLAKQGVPAFSHPLFAVEPVVWSVSGLDRYDAILAGSANAFRHGGKALKQVAHLPVYSVGDKTARAARQAGFSVAGISDGTLQDLLPGLARDGRRCVLRLAGRDRTRIDIPTGIAVDSVTLYASQTLPMMPDLVSRLAAPAVIPLFSARAARHFESGCVARNVDTGLHRIACMSQKVAAGLRLGWDRVAIAPRPTEQALLAVAVQLCQKTVLHRDPDR